MGADFHKIAWGWDNEFPSYGLTYIKKFRFNNF